MRRSFGGNRGGGGGGGNGNMLRTLTRTVSRASTIKQETTTSINNNRTIKSPTSPTVSKSRNNSTPLSLSSPPASSAANSPFITSSPTGQYRSRSWRNYSSSSSVCDDFDWVSVDDYDYFDDGGFVLGPVPSRLEAQSAVTALQQVIETASMSQQLVRDKYGTSSDTDILSGAVSPTSFNHRSAFTVSESDWSEPTLQWRNTRELQPYGSSTVYDAFHLLQTDPSVQRMVISLSSDPAVWNAVLNNEVVQELRQTLSSDNDSMATVEDDSDAAAASILKWLFNNTKAKVTEIIDMINRLVNDLFQPFEGVPDKTSSTTDSFEEKLRYSLMLTVVVLLIVAVARAKRA